MSDALKLAEQWTGRADDAGLLARAILGVHADFKEALGLLESCLGCDLYYDTAHATGMYTGNEFVDTRDFADVVKEFLEKHKEKP